MCPAAALNKSQRFSSQLLTTKPNFELDVIPLKYNATPKILGITLDEQLDFEDHMQSVTMMASNSLRIIREVKGFATISLVCSIMEYRAVIRQYSRHTGKLLSIQRKALSLCLGLPSTSGAELVGIAAGVLPIDLYFTQIAIKEMAKIQAKSISRPIKCLLNQMTEDQSQHSQCFSISPTQAEEMKILNQCRHQDNGTRTRV